MKILSMNDTPLCGQLFVEIGALMFNVAMLLLCLLQNHYGQNQSLWNSYTSSCLYRLCMMTNVFWSHLATRVREHTTSPSAIKAHLSSSCTTCKDNYSCKSFKVIDSAHSDFEVSIKEALHNKHKSPNLNKQLSTQGMSFMLKIFT